MPLARPIRAAASVLPWVLPVTYIVHIVADAGHLQSWDYWSNLRVLFSSDDTGALTPVGDWFRLYAQHCLFVPRLIYLSNILAFGGSNRYLCFFAVVFAAAQAVILYHALPRQVRADPSSRITAVATISVLTFTPQAMQSWLIGMSGIAWIPANFFAIASLSLACRHLESRSFWSLVLSILAGITAAVTYGTGLVALPLVVFILVAGRRFGRREALPVLASLAILGGFYSAGYVSADYAEPWLEPIPLANFALNILGGIFFRGEDLAQILALVGLGAIGFLATQYFSAGRRPRGMLFWLALALYGLVNIGLMATARNSMGQDGLTVSRYATIPSLFWLAVFVLSLAWLQENRPDSVFRGRFPFVVAGALIMTCVSAGSSGYYRGLRAEQDLVAISIRLGVVDPKKTRAGALPGGKYMQGLIPLMRKIEHYPFNDHFVLDCGRLGDTIDDSVLIRPQPRVSPIWGSVEGLRAVKPGLSFVRGSLSLKEAAVECLVLTDEDRRVTGAAILDYKNVPRQIKNRPLRVPWRGYLGGVAKPGKVTALVKLRDRDGLYVLEDKSRKSSRRR